MESVIFDGKLHKEPTSQSRIVSGVRNYGSPTSFGNIAMIDTGLGAGWSAAKGVIDADGNVRPLDQFIVDSNNTPEMRSIYRGGVVWDAADVLYNPSTVLRGAGKVFHLKAAKTTAPRFMAYIKTSAGVSWGYCDNSGVVSSSPLTLRNFSGNLNPIFVNGAEIKLNIYGGTLSAVQSTYYIGDVNTSTGEFTVYIDSTTTTPVVLTGTLWYADFSVGSLPCKIEFVTKEEGAVCNGALDTNSNLYKGYGVRLTRGERDTTKFMFKFYLGTWKGEDAQGYLYDGMSKTDAGKNAKLLLKSNEFTTWTQFYDWAIASETFNSLFEFGPLTSAGTVNTSFTTADATNLPSMNLFAGGTDTYDTTAYDAVLAAIKELNNSLFLSMEFGADAAGTKNLSLIGHIINDATFKKFVIIGGKDNKSGFADSKTSAASIDSRYGIVCHGGEELPYILTRSKMVKKSAFYFAAKVCGALAGLPPQTPLTFKKLRMGTSQHVMTVDERVEALEAGVLHMRLDNDEGWVVNQAVNTLQVNNAMYNPDGSSPEISIERISAQMNKEIASEGKTFLGKNRGAVGEADVVAFGVGYLERNKVIAGQRDGMIIDYKNVKAERQGAFWYLTYEFEPNSPINGFFATGTIIDPTI